MEKKVTYYLGAGASYNALPINAEFKKVISHFVNLIQDFNNSPLYNIKNKVEVLRHLNAMGSHPTLDTYAKKIYIRYGEGEEYFLVKNLICSIFVFLELLPIIFDRSNMNFANESKYDIDSDKMHIQEENLFYRRLKRNYDERYDHFLSYFLKRSGVSTDPILPSNISILSWNYDSQLEKCYASFCNLGRPIHLNDNIHSPKVGTKEKVIKINGLANFGLMDKKVPKIS